MLDAARDADVLSQSLPFGTQFHEENIEHELRLIQAAF